MGMAGGVDDGVEGRVAVGDLTMPSLVDIAERPSVLERGAGCFAASIGAA